MAGQVEDIEYPVAGVEHVALVEIAGQRRGRQRVGAEVITLMRKRGEKFGADPVSAQLRSRSGVA